MDTSETLHAIEKLADAASSREIRLMEVCGTHTMSILKHGLRSLLPAKIKLISGPGCPVCVTPIETVDRFIAISRLPSVIACTFGDMMKVPGTESILERERALAADIRVVYSPSDALKIARLNSSKRIVLLGIGFETTAPLVASVLNQAKREAVDNFFVLSAHKLIPPALRALLQDGKARIDGFLCPGHVSVIIGSKSYDSIASDYKKPCVVSGFEGRDILEAIEMLLKQIADNRAEAENQYRRCVGREGNPIAQQRMAAAFRPCESKWRGLGDIPASGLTLRSEYESLDAESTFRDTFPKREAPSKTPDSGCSCGEILQGIKTPPQCPLFAKSCTPAKPVGPCMISDEGVCAAYFKYGAEGGGA